MKPSIKLTLAGVVCVLVGVGVGGGFGAGASPELPGDRLEQEPFTTQHGGEPGGEAKPIAERQPDTGRYLVALVDRSTVLYARPRGRPLVRIEKRTEFGTQRWLSIVKERRGWIAVTVPELPNGRFGWMKAENAAEIRPVNWALRADVSRRSLVVERGGRVIKRIPVAVGVAGHPTPPGRYGVTDRLRVNEPGSPYGCCVLALTGHQTQLPAGWPGGDRLAVHATSSPGSIGLAASLGCMRVHTADARWLVRKIPIGTPVFIRE